MLKPILLGLFCIHKHGSDLNLVQETVYHTYYQSQEEVTYSTRKTIAYVSCAIVAALGLGIAISVFYLKDKDVYCVTRSKFGYLVLIPRSKLHNSEIQIAHQAADSLLEIQDIKTIMQAKVQYVIQKLNGDVYFLADRQTEKTTSHHFVPIALFQSDRLTCNEDRTIKINYENSLLDISPHASDRRSNLVVHTLQRLQMSSSDRLVATTCTEYTMPEWTVKKDISIYHKHTNNIILFGDKNDKNRSRFIRLHIDNIQEVPQLYPYCLNLYYKLDGPENEYWYNLDPVQPYSITNTTISGQSSELALSRLRSAVNTFMRETFSDGTIRRHMEIVLRANNDIAIPLLLVISEILNTPNSDNNPELFLASS